MSDHVNRACTAALAIRKTIDTETDIGRQSDYLPSKWELASTQEVPL
jgi:hypothetical protein